MVGTPSVPFFDRAATWLPGRRPSRGSETSRPAAFSRVHWRRRCRAHATKDPTDGRVRPTRPSSDRGRSRPPGRRSGRSSSRAPHFGIAAVEPEVEAEPAGVEGDGALGIGRAHDDVVEARDTRRLRRPMNGEGASSVSGGEPDRDAMAGRADGPRRCASTGTGAPLEQGRGLLEIGRRERHRVAGRSARPRKAQPDIARAQPPVDRAAPSSVS